MPGRILSAAQCDRIRRLCATYDDATVRRLTGVGAGTLYELRKRAFRAARRKNERPVPSDWGLVAPGKAIGWLIQHYRTGPRTITRWRREKPMVGPGRGHRRKDRPVDLREVLARMNVADAEAHYDVSNAVLSRWRREIGIATRTTPAAARTSWVERYVEERGGASL